MAQIEILHAYRHLYRQCLRAVQYSKPARYTARDRLRYAFRTKNASEFNPVQIQTTLGFLHGAAQTRGLEHKIVKNLLHVWATRGAPRGERTIPGLDKVACQQFDDMVAMLEKTAGIRVS